MKKIILILILILNIANAATYTSEDSKIFAENASYKVAKILTENGNDIDFNEKNIFFVKISFDVLEQIIHTEGVTLNDRQNEEALSVLEMYEFGKNLIENNKIKKENIFYYAYIVSPSRSDSRFSVCGIELNNLIDESYKIFSEFGNYFDISFSNDVVTIMFD